MGTSTRTVVSQIGVLVAALLLAGCGRSAQSPRVDASVTPAPDTSLQRAALFAKIEKVPTDRASRQALSPLLQPDDRGRIALLLSEAQWSVPGFYQYVQWMHTVAPALLVPPVETALHNVARAHPKRAVREWALTALGRVPGAQANAFAEFAAAGSPEALKAQVRLSSDGFATLYEATASPKVPLRDAAYELLVGPATLGIELSAEHRVRLLDLVAVDIANGIEGRPWKLLRVAHQLLMTRPALPAATETRLLAALRPFCISRPGEKPWWDALLGVAQIKTKASEALLQEAIAAAQTEGRRRVLRERLGSE